MELYVLGQSFLRETPIEDYSSVIWTERYNTPGEFQLTLPASYAAVNALAEGSFIAEAGTKEVMMVDTQSIENGLLTVKGSTLLDFLQHRIIRTTKAHADKIWTLYELTPGQSMGEIVQQMCIGGSYLDDNLGVPNGLNEKIQNLAIGDTDSTGDPTGLPIDFGPVLDALQKIADTYSLGHRLFLDSATPSGYQLLYESYAGLDRTTGNYAGNEIVSFSPIMDTLAGLKELRSIKGFKTVAYAYAPAEDVLDLTGFFGQAFAPGVPGGNSGFNRRTLMVYDDNLKSSDLAGVGGGSASILDMISVLDEVAKNALANNNFTKVVDGEIVPQAGILYGYHYKLGDIVELQSATGEIQKARITEYIRTQDATGIKSYPTVTVIE